MAKWILSVACVAALAGGSVSTAAAQEPLKATFRCANSSACPTGEPTDGIQGDGHIETVGDDIYTFNGYHTFTAGKGKGTTYIDGAYLNGNGGISIRLVPGGASPERTLQFRFGWRVIDLPGTPSTDCNNVDGSALSAADVDFRFNVPGGIGSMAEGATEELDLGVVNFTSGSIRGALYFNHSKDDITPWQGGVTLTRGSGARANTWVLTSDSTVLLQCAVGPKGRFNDVGTYHMPFQLTVER